MRLVLVALCLVVTACAGTYLPRAAHVMRDASVFLQGAEYNCSGTVISKTQILTAGHCLPGPGGTIAVIFRDGSKSVAHTMWQSDNADIGILETDTDAKVAAQIDCKPLEWGEPFWWIGNPSILQWNYSDGYVSYDGHLFVDGRDTSLVPVHANFNPGDSGAGLFSPDGKLRGVVSSFLTTVISHPLLPFPSLSQSGVGLAVPTEMLELCDAA